MTDLADIIVRDVEAPEPEGLQERLLQAMYLMERHRGVEAGGIDCVPDVLDADVSAPTIQRLAVALEKFIRAYPMHPDVGSAIWALSSLRDPSHTDLFTAVADSDSAYNGWARDQALCAIDNLK